MKADKEDSTIRRLYQRLREEDEAFLPSFEKVLSVGKDQAGPRIVLQSWHFRLAALVVVLTVLISPLFYFMTRRAAEPQGEISVNLSEWKSPTDFLLTFSETSLWTTLPTIDAEIPRWAEEREKGSLN
jgi:hypothetical protein